MAETRKTARREKITQMAQAAVQWIPVLLVPLVFYLITATQTLYREVYAAQAASLTRAASELERSAALTIRVAKIEGDRFTKEDGGVLLALTSELRVDLAVLESQVHGLKIPPPIVEQSLIEIKQRLDRLESFLHRQLAPALPAEQR